MEKDLNHDKKQRVLHKDKILLNINNIFLATVVQAALEAANIMIKDAVTSANQVLKETQALLKVVDELTIKYQYLLTASSNVTKLIVEGQAQGTLNLCITVMPKSNISP
jgi:hypothetical protein